MFSSKSFYQQEEERKFNLIKLPLLQLTLENLPFAEFTVELEDDKWETVAVRINSLFPQENLTYSGLYMKEKYEKLYKNFMGNYKALLMGQSPIPIILENFFLQQSEEDYYLYNIFKLQHYNVQVIAKLAQDNFEEEARRNFIKNKTLLSSKIYKNNENYEKMGNTALISKIDYLQNELDKKDRKIEQLIQENKNLQILAQNNLQDLDVNSKK
ncbi:hypothetical protein PACTADRAFT_32571 [Pachysolen tannophilus NRRL Y-2460]|uniref:Uncharacterized protein n=1 Tax=Pachysolen tannophilus NRRL Y-2460 TaxID=669874 RepID=A0A1E4TZA5_PACTA|nr:hypothetical protein PACTADRAFT_32571 [Pachysolen tannophilus NRRL Y-2460]